MDTSLDCAARQFSSQLWRISSGDVKVFSWEAENAGEVRLPKDIIGRLHYEVIEGGNKYFLLGIGADNSPFTVDDTLPAFGKSKSEQIGLIVEEI